jgi:arsenate reductase-like glutaredoxin family protein
MDSINLLLHIYSSTQGALYHTPACESIQKKKRLFNREGNFLVPLKIIALELSSQHIKQSN